MCYSLPAGYTGSEGAMDYCVAFKNLTVSIHISRIPVVSCSVPLSFLYSICVLNDIGRMDAHVTQHCLLLLAMAAGHSA